MLLLKSPVSMKGAGSSVRGLLTQQFRLNDEIPALVRIERRLFLQPQQRYRGYALAGQTQHSAYN